MSAQIKILLVDDHEIIRDGLKSMILNNDFSDRYCFLDAESIFAARSILVRDSPDLIFLDYRLKDGTGEQLLVWMKKSNITIPTIAISNYSERSYIDKMITAGASGYLLKDVERAVLTKAIEAVLSGRTYYYFEDSNGPKSEAIPEYVISQYNITKREQEILSLFIEQLTPKEISAKLHISYRTVETHRQNLFSKFHVNNMVALIRGLLTKGL